MNLKSKSEQLESEYQQASGLGDFLDGMSDWLSDYPLPEVCDLDDQTIYQLVKWYKRRKKQAV